ncbi:Nuclear hormone receptor family member nhr-48, partial [Fragariocoptes setiger]
MNDCHDFNQQSSPQSENDTPVNPNRSMSPARNTNSSSSIEQSMISESSNSERKYRPQKFCAVCGDRAIACNFNAVTCESCKAFFRRNAFKDRMKCLFEDKCVIDKVTRRFCSRCRLKKCFEIGMKREWILSEDEKEKKRIKIMQNRQKKARSTPTEMRDNNSENDYTDSSPSVSGQRNHKVYTRDVATACPDISDLANSSGPGLWCIHGCSYCSSVHLQQRSALFRPTPNGLQYSGIMKPHTATAEYPTAGYVQVNIGTSMNGSTTYISPNCVSINSNQQQPHASSGHNDQHLQNSIQTQPSRQQQPHQTPQHQMSTRYPPTTPYASTIPHNWNNAVANVSQHSLLVPQTVHPVTSQSGNALSVTGYSGTLVNLSTEASQQNNGSGTFMNMLLNNLDSLYDKEPNRGDNSNRNCEITSCDCHPIESCSFGLDSTQQCFHTASDTNHDSTDDDSRVVNIGLCGASADIYDGPKDKTKQPFRKEIKCVRDETTGLSFAEPCTTDAEIDLRLSVLNFFPNEVARMEEILHVTRKMMFEHHCSDTDCDIEKNPVAFSTLVSIFEASLKRVIGAVKSIRSFRELTIDDQITLIKTHCFKILILRSAFHYNDEINGWLDPRTGRPLDLSGLHILKSTAAWDRQFDFIYKFDRYLRKDKIIVTLLLSIIVFDASSVMANLNHRYSIHLEHVTYLTLLKKYITHTQPDPLTKYERLMSTLSLLNIANEEYTRFFAQSPQPSEISPLMMEIFDIGSI